MEVYRRSHFFFTPPAILKVVEMVVLVTTMILFLVDNKCSSDLNFIIVFILPCVACTLATLVSYISAVMVLISRRNPLTTPAWVKGDVCFNISALVLMLVGSIITLTREECVNSSITVAALALGFISVILFAISGAVTYLVLVRHQQEVKETQRAQLNARRLTMSELA
ncbi:uncharacterized protein LOC135222637 isoform X1 [Macrobrachium nipponense]|uniref:uncharacterized protein LOC135222637 isoform X1 n=1 Tax=Macrobrachium nipponense TaxID=159736 RepID=UPI0030C7FD26